MDLVKIDTEVSVKGFLDLLRMFKGEVAVPLLYTINSLDTHKQSLLDVQRHYKDAQEYCKDALAIQGVEAYSNLQKKPFIAFAKSVSYIRRPNIEDAKLDFLITSGKDKVEFDKLFRPVKVSSFSENTEKLIITDLEGKTFGYKGPNRPIRTVFYSIIMPKDDSKDIITLIKELEYTADSMVPTDCENTVHNNYELFIADKGLVTHTSILPDYLSDNVMLATSLKYGLKPLIIESSKEFNINADYSFAAKQDLLNRLGSN